MALRTLCLAALCVAGLAACTDKAPLTAQAEATLAQWRERDMYLSAVRALLQQNKAQAAIAFLEDYERRFPDDMNAWSLRGEALVRSGDAAGAEAVYTRLFRRGVRPEADFGLGQVHAIRGQWWRALTRFKDAADMAPANPRYLNNYGYALLKNGKVDLGYKMLARAFELDPKNPQLRNNYILAAHVAGRREETMRALGGLPHGELEGVMRMLSEWSAKG